MSASVSFLCGRRSTSGEMVYFVIWFSVLTEGFPPPDRQLQGFHARTKRQKTDKKNGQHLVTRQVCEEEVSGSRCSG